VKFYAATGLIFNIEARQLGDRSDVRLDLYYEQTNGALLFVGGADHYGAGSGFAESISLDLKTGQSGLWPGMYYVRVSSADTNLFGADSECELRIYVPIGPAGGVIRISSQPQGSGDRAFLQIYLHPQAAIDAGGAWGLPDRPSYSATTNTQPYFVTFTSAGTHVVNFKQIAGWDLISSTNVTVTMGNLTEVHATYTRSPSLAVSLAGNLVWQGFARGPFTPQSITCTLSNSGESPCDWSASQAQPWLTLAPGSGTLEGGANVNVTLSLNADANSLAAGSYTNLLGFNNLANGRGNTNSTARLVLAVHPPVMLLNPRVLADGHLAMTLQGLSNRSYSILSATNLLTPAQLWTEVLRLTNNAGQTLFTNPAPTSSQRYYRAKEQ